MKACLVTGSGGLIGSEAVRHFIKDFDYVIGIDNNLREYMFGVEASTEWNVKELHSLFDEKYIHYKADIRNMDEIESIFNKHSVDICAIIHCAACPSHDWAKKEPITDFDVNARGTLLLLEMTRKYCPEATFIFCSTNKVYGDRPNYLPLAKTSSRFILDPNVFINEDVIIDGTSLKGVSENMSIDQSIHSLFGTSKVAADVITQEYGKYFGIKTGVFRGGCLTGGHHSGTELHGFLAYLGKCILTKKEYNIFGRGGYTVRDNIHSSDVLNVFETFIKNPKAGNVYNLGGGTHSNCSMLEAIKIFEDITGNKAIINYVDEARVGDHMWYISDMSKFKKDYINWEYTYDINMICNEIIESLKSRM